MKLILFFLLWVISLPLMAQSKDGFKWSDPTTAGFQVIEGQAESGGLDSPFDRIPKMFKKDLRPAVWNKSRQSTGLLIRLRTNAKEIRVRYKVSGIQAFEHMPATGVSGLDLYGIGEKGGWKWTGANYTFGDTIHYQYPNLYSGTQEYHLYLPLYNNVTWLNIGVPEGTTFEFLPARTTDRLIIYGTSIAQGGCASRPGLAWTAQLGRMLKMPVVNLAFSSNGMLEKPVLELIAGSPAKVFVLDCLPNLSTLPNEEIQRRLLEAVRFLQEKRPEVPIVMAEHADAKIGLLDASLQGRFEEVNVLMRGIFSEMKIAGKKDIYLLTANEIALDNESTVDGQHPNDIGMQLYAKAYTSLIQRILMKKKYSLLPDENTTFSTWLGFNRTDFHLGGRAGILVSPDKPAVGNPWIWRTEFFGHEPQADSTLVAKGFHVAYIDLTDMYGAPRALDIMDECYRFLVDKIGLNKKVVLEGFSRGGLFALNWAARRPDQVSAIYLDAPVCDFKSWPGNLGKGPGSVDDWNKMKKVYEFKSDKEALKYRFNPVDHLEPLAKYHIPILSVCGDADKVVPLDENTYLLKKRYEQLGGEVKLIIKPGIGHHPHSLKDPEPIVEFILGHPVGNLSGQNLYK